VNDRLPSRRTFLHGGVAVGVTSLAALATVKGLAASAVAGVPTASSRAALATSSGCATLTKEETQGPFWVDERLNRSDIRYDTGSAGTGAAVPGVPLTLTINLQDAGAGCRPQVGAYVDIWHANAAGAYSDVSGSGNPNEVGHNFLRGYQVSDADGQVTFTTVYPGWYVSRTIHIHFRVRLALDSTTTVDFTSQLFFDETINDTVQAQTGLGYQGSGRDTINSTDQLYDASLLVPLTGNTTDGYAGAFTVNLDFGDGASDGSSSTDDDDTVVSATVEDVTVKRRKVKVAVHSTEAVAAKIRLVDHDDVLVRKTTGWLRAGTHKVTLRVPAKVDPGRYRVTISLADKAGNKKIVRRRVRVR
jgi:protocatechuate 3,4-dioxygenase beta subunit